MTGWTLADLLANWVELPCEGSPAVSGLTLNSQQVKPGDLFFACQGTQTHGIAYADEAIANGASAILWEPTDEVPSELIPQTDDIPWIAIPELKRVMGKIASRFYGHPSQYLFTIGITGTNGKTTCSHLISKALNHENYPCAVMGTLGYGLLDRLTPSTHTTPDVLSVHQQLCQMQSQGARAVAMEVSSHALDQDRVNGVHFKTALFTNLTRDHLDYHADMEHYGQAKARLFLWESLEQAILSVSDSWTPSILSQISPQVDKVFFGLQTNKVPVFTPDGKYRYLWGREVTLNRHGLSMTIVSSWGISRIESRLLGRFNAENLLAVAAVLLTMGFSFDRVIEDLQTLGPVNGRVERFGGNRGQPLVIVDYAHTPDALRQALSAVRSAVNGQVWCLFGCGGERDQGKRAEMGSIAESYADHVVVTSDNPRREDPLAIIQDICAGMRYPGSAHINSDRLEAIAYAIRMARPGDGVLIAGKGHEEYQIIGNIKQSFSDRYLVSRLLGKTAMDLIPANDAYAHGFDGAALGSTQSIL